MFLNLNYLIKRLYWLNTKVSIKGWINPISFRLFISLSKFVREFINYFGRPFATIIFKCVLLCFFSKKR